MKEIVYYYGVIYIIFIVKNIYERFFQKKELEDIEIDITDASNIQKLITFDFIWFIVNMVWMFIGCFSEEHFSFMILLVFFTILIPVTSIITKTSKSNALSLITNVGRLFIASYIMYHHFLIK